MQSFRLLRGAPGLEGCTTSASRGKSGITYDQTTFPTGAYNGLHFVLRSPGVNCNAL